MDDLRNFENNTQNYIKWNRAFVNHFFNEQNIGNEVILYADPELISMIGTNNCLGTYDDFLNTIIVDFEYRLDIYYKLSYLLKREVEVNKQIKKIITEFPNTLSEAKLKVDIPFFNYIIFYISIYVDNNTSSFYQNLNNKINKYLPNSRRIQSLSELDKLFEVIEKWSLKKGQGIFRARRIGDLNYIGLLNYQVVLKPELNKLFESLLYQHNITVDDNAIYPELANKLLPYTTNPALRKKLINAIKSPVYSEWFLNRTLSFNHEQYGKSNNGSQIKVTRKGKLTFKIKLENLSINLISDTLLLEDEIPKDFNLPQSGIDNYGYYSEPISLLNNQKISFKEYKFITSDDSLELETININDVNFFVKTPNGYLLTLIPLYGYDLLILVRNKDHIIKQWERWSSNPKNIEQNTRIKNEENLLNIFDNRYVFYSANNIKNAFYKNEDNVIYETNSLSGLNFKKLGGLKINRNTYLDIGLPYFKLDNSEIDSSEIKVKVYRNSAKDNDIIVKCSEGSYRLFINDQVTINEPYLVIVKFNYQNLEKSFDFTVVGSKLKSISQNELFKFNSWGEKTSNSAIKYVQGNSIVNGHNILLNTNRHQLAGLSETTSFDDNYFIYLLTGLDYLNEICFLKRSHINRAIDAALIYLESQDYILSEEKYSRTNLISNLCALGFLSKLKDEENIEKYQLLPPSLVRIEKTCNVGSKQVYQLLGTRSKYMIQRLVGFCENENIQIRYKRYNIQENNTLEKALLPEIIYLDIGDRLDKIKGFFVDEFDIHIHIESEYHIGDSLNKFINSVTEFETEYLNNKINLENQPLDYVNTNLFPRIVESSEFYQSNGQAYKIRFVEKREKEYYKIKNIDWSRLYVSAQTKQPTLLMKRQYDGHCYKLSPNTYIPSKYRLPDIVYKAFCSINHGIPKTIKIFIKNANGIFNIDNQSYMHFDFYKFSDKEGRREDITRIITGSRDMHTSQVKFCSDINNNLKFVSCSLFSNIKSAVLIFDNKGVFTALISNYKEVFINVDRIDKKGIATKSCHFDDEIFNVLKVNNEEYSLNQKISKILDENLAKFKFETPYRNIRFEIVKDEKIEIKELN